MDELDAVYRHDSEELAGLASTVRRFVETELAPHELHVDRDDAFPEGLLGDLQERARAIGLYAFNFPAEAGGPGLCPVAQVVVREQVGRTTQAMAEVAHRPPLSLLAAEGEQWDRFTRPAADGRLTVCLALSEADTGSDLRAVRTRAVPSPDGWLIHGEKHFISHFDEADEAVVLARTGEIGAPDALTAFMVPLDDERIARAPLEKMGWRGYRYGSLTFDGVPVDESRVLGGVGGGLRTVMRSVNSSRLSVAAHCVGTAIWAMERTVDWTRRRQAFGSALSDKQGLRWRIAEIWSEIVLVRSALLRAAEILPDGPGTPASRAETAMLKLRATELVGRAVDLAVQVHGAAGYSSEVGIELRYRDVRAFRIGEGASELLLDMIGAHAVRSVSA